MPILLTSKKGANFKRGRHLSAAHKQRISQSLRQGKSPRQKKVGLLPFQSVAHRAAYNELQGKKIATDINRKNPKMNATLADNYVRESSSSYLLAKLGKQKESDRELARVNRKYDPYFNE